MNSALKKAGLATAALLVGSCVVYLVQGPNGINDLLERERQRNALKTRVEDLIKEKERKAEELRIIRERPQVIERHLRERTRQVKPGDSIFIVPGETGTKPPADR